MVKLNPLGTPFWRRLSRRYRTLLVIAGLLLLGLGLGLGLGLPALLGGHAHTRAAIRDGQPAAQLPISDPTSSAPAGNRPRSSHAARPTLTTSSTPRRGPAPSVTVTAPGHPNQISSWPSRTTPIHRVTPSATPSSRPRLTHTSHPPAPAPSPHVIGDGGLVGSTNSFREANGTSSLGYSSGLTGDAEQCALQMARNSSVAHCGGNQVVAGAWSIGGCMSLFESDPDHRDVLLSSAFGTAGSGVAVDAAGAYYCVINFA
jgi:uncharacterized protein YkwD